MNDVIILIILVIPPVFIGILWWNYSKREKELQAKIEMMKFKTERSKIISPLKISAYERLIAMMERFKLAGLVIRNNKNVVGSSQLQLELMNAIRSEFEMNISMQMYVSNSVWKQVIKGQEQSLNSIKEAGMKVGLDASAMKLSQEIFILEESHKNREIQIAVDLLKQEVKANVLNG